MGRVVIAFWWVATIASASPLLLEHNARPLQMESQPEALIPWETATTDFFVRSHHEAPVIDPAQFTLVIDGLVAKPLRLSLRDLQKLPQHSLHAVLECSGNGRGLQAKPVSGIPWKKGAVGNAEWSGVALAELLKMAKPLKEARYVRAEGADLPALPSVPPFVRSIPLEKALEGDSLVGLRMNREPLQLLHGGPMRLILPRWYGQNWIKWVRHLTLTDKEDEGFYMKNGYRMPREKLEPGAAWKASTGTPIQELRVQSLLVEPQTAQEEGSIRIAGKTFTGTGTIAKVEVSHDGGTHWIAAVVEPPRASGGWQGFSSTLHAIKPGTLTVLSRATDTAGHTQPLENDWNPGGYLRNNIDRLEVQVLSSAEVADQVLLSERCLVCHSAEMIHAQKLPSEAWEKVLKKMESFGAVLDAAETSRLVKYLAARPTPRTPSPPPGARIAAYSFVKTKQPIGGGRALYGQYCAACHAEGGEGKLGPRLKARTVPEELFYEVVSKGKGNMPSFEASLSRKQVDQIRAYLRGS